MALEGGMPFPSYSKDIGSSLLVEPEKRTNYSTSKQVWRVTQGHVYKDLGELHAKGA